MMRPVPLKSIEEGYEWSVPAPAPKRKPLPLRQCLVALLCALVVGQVVFVLQLPFLHQVQERVGAQGVVCLSPLHVWGVNASSVSFPTQSFAALKLVSGEGRVVSKVRGSGLRPLCSKRSGCQALTGLRPPQETSTLCPGVPPRTAQRYQRVVVEHRTPPWPWARRVRLEGEQAVCLQHMLDLFRGVSPCSR
jgi:hypothetical protein